MSNWSQSDEDFEREYALGVDAEKVAAQVEPRATSARFESESSRLVIGYAAGYELAVPVELIKELRSLSVAELRQVRVTPGGEGLEWEAADVHVSVPGMTWDLVGSRELARQVIADNARRAAGTRSEARAAAARQNGKKGGRPRKRASVAETEPRATVAEEQ